MYPIIWAHHDDHRYIGRPYTPWENLPEMLKARHSKGFGIIHWTTHPLDLYFTCSARQVWESTENESIQETVDNYVKVPFGENDELAMKAKSEKRLKLLNGIPRVKNNTFLQYQKAMEEFYISFFDNHLLFQDA